LSGSPVVSVVVATHNHAHFLPECLASVKAQTYEDYELIVVDNGSVDNTKEIVYNLAWDKLKYYYQEDTGSVAGSRNTGIRLARGKYIAFLDSDDLWHERKLEEVMKLLEGNSEIDIISHAMFQKEEGKEKIFMSVGPLRKNMFAFLLGGNRLLGSATVVKKNVLCEVQGFNERKDFVHAEDYDLWLKIAYSNGKFFFISEPLGEYRIHASNLSRDFVTVFQHEINVLNAHIRNFKSRIPCHKEFLYSGSLSRIYFMSSFNYFAAGQYKKALFRFVRSLFLNPVLSLRLMINYCCKFVGKLFRF